MAEGSSAEPGRRRWIVDSQVHLWKAEAPDRPWPPGGAARAQLPHPFAHEVLLRMMDVAGVDRVVVVPPSFEGDRNDYALEAASRHPDRFAVMGRIPLENKDAASLLLRWRDQPGMLGIRVTFLGAHASCLTDGTADRFWPAAEKAGIPVMCLATRIAELARIAERHPQLTLIIDHMGISGEMLKAGKRAEMVEQTIGLAKHANVSVKLSSAPAYTTDGYPFRDMTPYIRGCFDAYGPQRCYWGTDMTNSLSKATYRERIAHFTEELGFLSEEDKDWVMGRAILQRLRWA